MNLNFFQSHFDHNYYVSKYKDLSKVDKFSKAWNHAKNYGYKEGRDIFKGDMELLEKFKHFRNTKEVKPIPHHYSKDKFKNKINIIEIHGGLGDIIKQFNLITNHIKKDEIVICVTAVAFDLKETVNCLFKEYKNKILFMIARNRDINKLINNLSFKQVYIPNADYFLFKSDNIYNNVDENLNIQVLVNKPFTTHKINYRFSTRKDYDFMSDNILYYKDIPISKLYVEESSKDLYDKVVNKIGKDYILIHSRPKDNCSRDLLPINEDYFLNRDLPIYNFDFDSDLNYGIKSNNIFDYYDIVKNAKEIHTYNGSLSHFIDYMDIELNNLNFHMYCKDKDEKIDYETYIKKNIRDGKWHNKTWQYYENDKKIVCPNKKSACIVYLFKNDILNNNSKDFYCNDKYVPSFYYEKKEEMIFSLDKLYENFNNKYKYPIYIFDENSLSEIDKEIITKDKPEITIVNIEFKLPDNIDPIELENKINNMYKIKGWSCRNVGYRNMCNWYSNSLFFDKHLKNYKYIMRLDHDSIIWNNLDRDPFEIIETHKLDYLYKVLQEKDNYSDKLYDLCDKIIPNFDKEYTLENNCFDENYKIKGFDKYKMIMDFDYDNDKEKKKLKLPFPFNNFFIINKDFWLKKEVQDFLKKIYDSKIIYFDRVGDANIHGIIMKYFNCNYCNINKYMKFSYGKWGLFYNYNSFYRKDKIAYLEKFFKEEKIQEYLNEHRLNSLNIYKDKSENKIISIINKYKQKCIKIRDNYKPLIEDIKKYNSIHKNYSFGNDECLKNKIISIENKYHLLIQEFKIKLKNITTIIYTCGPSLTEDYKKNDVKNFSKGKLRVAVKESINEYDSHIFFINDSKFIDYKTIFNLNTKNFITIYNYSNSRSGFKGINKIDDYDIIIPNKYNINEIDIEQQLISTKNFNDYRFCNEFKRPWGPGILYEIVFYFLEMIKSNNCYILGWDLSLSGELNHFYDNSKKEKYQISNNIYFNDLKHFEKDWDIEMKNVINATEEIYNYFKKNNLNLICLSKQSNISSIIPRNIIH